MNLKEYGRSKEQAIELIVKRIRERLNEVDECDMLDGFYVRYGNELEMDCRRYSGDYTLEEW